MAKRSARANLGRAARKAAKRPRPTTRINAPPPDLDEPQLIPDEPTPEQINTILHAQINVVRNAFFKLAQARAADRVRFNELSWEQGTEYINAEISGLDQQLVSVVPQ